MRLTWRKRLEQQPSLMDLNEWPKIDALDLARNKRAVFLRNQKIIAQALAQIPLKKIASTHQVDPSLITHLLNRALGGDNDEMPPLTKALIPRFRLTSGYRHKVLSTLAAPAGDAHSLNHLLETVPGLQQYLKKLLQMFLSHARRGQNLRVNIFHKAFLRFLRQSHWPSDCHPFTTQSLGYESIRRYFHTQLNLLAEPTESIRIILPSRKPVSIFSEMEIDEHTVDCNGSVVVSLNGLWEPLRLARVSLVAAREVTTSAVLAAVLILRGSVSRDDILALLAHLTTPWISPELKTPGLQYPPGIYMPTALGEDFRRPAYGIFRFDNAMVHRASDVRDFICDELGATLNLGIPKYPLARVLIESAFKDLNLTIHRLPSTTGSHANDPVKEPAYQHKTAPVVSIKTLEEIILVHIANMNRKALGNLGSASPIEVMQAQMASHWVPLRPELALRHANPNIARAKVPVCFESSQHRRPWVNFAHLRYDAPRVLDASMRKKDIWVEFDRRDIRELKAFTLEGEILGTLYAPRTWLRFPHSLMTRNLIFKLKKTEDMNMEDPFGTYFDYLLKHRSVPTEALELVRFNREIGDFAAPINQEPTDPPIGASKPLFQDGPLDLSIPDWSLIMIDKRRG